MANLELMKTCSLNFPIHLGCTKMNWERKQTGWWRDLKIVPEIHITPSQCQEEVPKAWGTRLKFIIPFHPIIIWTDVDRLPGNGRDLKSCILNGWILKQTFGVGRVNSVKDEAIDDVIHFLLTYLNFRYLMIRSFEWDMFPISNSVLCSFCVCWITICMRILRSYGRNFEIYE